MIFAITIVLMVIIFLAYANLCENYKLYDFIFLVFLSLLYLYSAIDLAFTDNYCGLLFIASIVIYHVLKICIDNRHMILCNILTVVLFINVITAIINFLTAPKVGIFYK